MLRLAELRNVLGAECLLIAPLGGEGVYLIRVGNDKRVVKYHPNAGIEAKMLQLLAPHLRVPSVVWNDQETVVMEYLEEGAPIDEAEAASLLASLHAVSEKRFGLDFDTTIGPHLQPNTPMTSWVKFYRNARVLSMAQRCFDKHRFGSEHLARIEKVAGRFDSLLPEPKPSLLHGDIWSGNVIGTKEGIAFIDPAVYFGHNEMELAFIQMFHTFGKRFFDVYHGLIPIEAGFFEERQYLYQLYPVLVHVNSFGEGYMGMLERILGRFD